MIYKLKSQVRVQDLERIGFEPDIEFNEDDGIKYITRFIYKIKSDKVKGTFSPFITIGHVYVDFNNATLSEHLWIDYNSEYKKEWEPKYEKLIKIMLENNLIEEVM